MCSADSSGKVAKSNASCDRATVMAPYQFPLRVLNNCRLSSGFVQSADGGSVKLSKNSGSFFCILFYVEGVLQLLQPWLL